MAEKNHSSFVVYADNPVYDEIGDEDLGRLFRAMITFVRTGEDAIPKSDPLRLAWLNVRSTLARDAERWEQTRAARVKAGSLGGKAKAANNKQT